MPATVVGDDQLLEVGELSEEDVSGVVGVGLERQVATGQLVDGGEIGDGA